MPAHITQRTMRRSSSAIRSEVFFALARSSRVRRRNWHPAGITNRIPQSKANIRIHRETDLFRDPKRSALRPCPVPRSKANCPARVPVKSSVRCPFQPHLPRCHSEDVPIKVPRGICGWCRRSDNLQRARTEGTYDVSIKISNRLPTPPRPPHCAAAPDSRSNTTSASTCARTIPTDLPSGDQLKDMISSAGKFVI
jgi:hypothetical protein